MPEVSQRTPEQIKQQVKAFAKALGQTRYPRKLVGFYVTPEEASELWESLVERSTSFGTQPSYGPKHFLMFGILLFSERIETGLF